jgi:hypothetical protein
MARHFFRISWDVATLRADCPGVALAVLVVMLLASRETLAQVDTPSAHDARKALHELRTDYRARPTWGPWARFINVEDIACELQAGDRAQAAALDVAATHLREDGQSTGPVSKRLAVALEARARELISIPAAQWPAECYRQAQHFEPATPTTVQKARQSLQDALHELERTLPALRRSNDGWARYLFWPETRSLVTSDSPDRGLLDRLEARWQAAISAWDSYELVEASFAVRSYIRLFRGYLANETQAQHAAAWDELGKLLESREQSPQADTSRIAAAVNRRERLGQGTSLTASIRRELSRPNILLRVRTPWLESQLAEKINEPFNVNDVYAGARTIGAGTLSADARCAVLSSNAVGQWQFQFDGTTQARATGSSEGVTVASHSTTQIHGVKPFTLDARGLTPKPATATASTAIVYDNINAGGRSRRRSEAVSQTHGRRPQAEAEAAASARRFVTEKMDAEGKDLAEKFNKSYRSQLHDRPFDTHRTPPDVRVRASNALLTWECRLEGPDSFAASGPPPAFEPDANVVLSIAASALEDQGLALLGDRELTAEQLSKVVGDLLGEPSKTEKSPQDFTAVFAKHPCDIQLADGKIRVRLHITSFESADVQYPAMTVDTEYSVEQRAGDLALVRQGSVRVKPIVQGEGGQQTLSGRQQTLRLAVQRKMNKALAEEFLWAAPALPSSEKEPRRLRVGRAMVDGGWLQIALGMKDEG